MTPNNTNRQPEPQDDAAGLRARVHALEKQEQLLKEKLAVAEAGLEHYAGLYELAPASYFSLTADGKIRQVNQAGAALLGKDVADLAGCQFADHVAGEDRPQFEAFLRDIFSHPPKQTRELTLLRADGSRRFVRISATASPNGQFCRAVLMDITVHTKVNEALRLSEEKFRSIVECSPTAMYLYKLEGDGRLVMQDANPAADRAIGIKHRSLIGCTVEEAFPMLIGTDVPEMYRKVARGEIGQQSFVISYADKRFSGYYEVHVFRTHPGTIVVAFVDISERKRAEDSLKASFELAETQRLELEATLEAIPASIAILDEHGTILRVNRKWKKFAEANGAHPESTAPGANYLAICDSASGTEREDGANFAQGIRDVLHGKSRRFAMEYPCHSPTQQRWFKGYVTSFSSASNARVVIAHVDITQPKLAEKELRKAHEELEMRVNQRTSTLQHRTTQLRALAGELVLTEERERRRIATLIHDHLQQILVGAMLNIEMLGAKPKGGAGNQSLKKVESLLQDALETTRSLTAELSPSVLHQCGLPAALQWLRPWCQEKYGLKLEVYADKSIEAGEEVRVTLFRSVRELLFNVVKHSKVKNARITMDRMPGGMVRIVVSDKGVGFDPREREAREGSSGGFGLFNIRERLELLGGGMKIQSTPGQGCQMTLWAPERVGPKTGVVSLPPLEDSTPKSNGRDEAKLPARRPQIKEQGKIRIVVADDHAVVRDGLVRAFADEPDFDVVGEATDGIEAVQFARELQPDFILMDVNMPRMDGIKATATIHAESPSVKILGLSMYNDEGHRNAMLEAGALDLLRKSNSAAHVISALRQHAGKP